MGMTDADLAPLASPRLAALPGIRHAFFTRQGGASTGLYDSLNVGRGSKDDPADVVENRRRAAAWFGVEAGALLTCYQIHSAKVLVADQPWGDQRPEADGVATTHANLVCGALSADCAPVLLADAEARVVAACHAGWKGALGGVIEAAVDGDDRPRRGAKPDRRRRRPLHRAGKLRGGAGVLGRVRGRRSRRIALFQARRQRRQTDVRSSGLRPEPAGARGRRPTPSGWATTPARRRRCSSPTAGRSSAARAITDGCCRRSPLHKVRHSRMTKGLSENSAAPGISLAGASDSCSASSEDD